MSLQLLVITSFGSLQGWSRGHCQVGCFSTVATPKTCPRTDTEACSAPTRCSSAKWEANESLSPLWKSNDTTKSLKLQLVCDNHLFPCSGLRIFSACVAKPLVPQSPVNHPARTPVPPAKEDQLRTAEAPNEVQGALQKPS